MLREIVTDFVLFSFVEGLLYAMFFNRVCKCKKFNLFEIIVMSIGNCVVSCLFPPLIYQIIMIGWMAFCLHLKNGTDRTTFQYVKYSFYGLLYSLITEMLYVMFFEFILNTDLFNFTKVQTFAVMIPIRLLQFVVIIEWREIHMKSWLGGVVRK